MEVVQTSWSTQISGLPSYVWEQKIKLTKPALKRWIKKHNNTPTSQLKETVQLLEYLQLELENKEISIAEIEKEQISQINSYRSFRLEEEHMRLKSRSLWFKVGDRNTPYFHRKYRAFLS